MQSAVENNGVRDASVNMAAFLESVSNESNKISAPICLAQKSNRRIEAFAGSDCTNLEADATPLANLELDAPMVFEATCPDVNDVCDDTDHCNKSWLVGSNGIFAPKPGLSAAPQSGYLCAKYGPNSSHYAFALKKKRVNSIIPATYDSEGWD